jgi:hypothetical protein
LKKRAFLSFFMFKCFNVLKENAKCKIRNFTYKNVYDYNKIYIISMLDI